MSIWRLWSLIFCHEYRCERNGGGDGRGYGGGAVRSKLVATLFVGAAALLGAVLGGKEVVGTISKGIVPSFLISAEIAVIILASACLTLFYADLAGIPLSTSEVTVGSVVGVGVAYQSLYFGKILLIVTVWFVLPFAALGIAYLLGKLTPRIEGRLQKIAGSKTRSVLILFLDHRGLLSGVLGGDEQCRQRRRSAGRRRHSGHGNGHLARRPVRRPGRRDPRRQGAGDRTARKLPSCRS